MGPVNASRTWSGVRTLCLYVALAVIVGGIVAGIAAWLGSGVWWLFGLVFAGVAFVFLCACFVGTDETRPRWPY